MSQKWPWIVAGVAAAAVAAVLSVKGAGGAVAHPDPRPGVTAERVLPPSLVPNTPGAAEAYAAARAVPHVLDGIHCHCECAKHFGHRSLLTCFESDHGSHCDICMGEAALAVGLASHGTPLDAIRHAIDQRFGS
ncbi:MAG TPA: CYCXC family (seleno)protein [Gemmatimonadales bacterium]|nr:CYCXC family (seleno)protein [Gemmatimonadales bacterium]